MLRFLLKGGDEDDSYCFSGIGVLCFSVDVTASEVTERVFLIRAIIEGPEEPYTVLFLQQGLVEGALLRNYILIIIKQLFNSRPFTT